MKEFNETKWWQIVFQRVNKFKYFKLACNTIDKNKGSEDDVISLEKMPNIIESDLNTFCK